MAGTTLNDRIQAHLVATNSYQFARYTAACGDVEGLRDYVLSDLASVPTLLAEVQAAEVDWTAFAAWLTDDGDIYEAMRHELAE